MVHANVNVCCLSQPCTDSECNLVNRFNKEFDQLKSQKHRDSDRLTDLASRMDELIRELVQIHILLNPAATSSHTTSGSAAAHPEQSAMMSAQASVVGITVDSVRSSTAGPPSPTARVSTMAAAGVTGVGGLVTAEQLAAELSVGRLVAHWSPLEDMEDMLFNIKPGEVKVVGTNNFLGLLPYATRQLLALACQLLDM